MNILYITNQLDIGGITSYVLSLASGMKKRGHRVYIASSGGQLLNKFKEEGIEFVPIPIKTKSEVSPKILASAFKLLKEVKENHIDIVHSHSRTTQVLGYLLSKKTGIKYISTCHGFFKKRFSRRMFPCWGINVIAISEPVKEHLIKDFGVGPETIRVIHNGIDLERFKESIKDDLGQRKKKMGLKEGPVIGIVARLSDVKGHVYLIEAMKAVLEKIPTAQLFIVGEGRMKEELIKLTKKNGLQENVLFLLSAIDTREVLSVMDLFTMPSLQEGLGLSLMEAMAMGLPVVGSAVGGIKSLIQHGVNGLLVKPADINSLSLAILDLLRDRKKAEILGNNARNFINQNFSQDKMVLETEKVYLECLESKS